jgi:hypothetical protein
MTRAHFRPTNFLVEANLVPAAELSIFRRHCCKSGVAVYDRRVLSNWERGGGMSMKCIGLVSICVLGLFARQKDAMAQAATPQPTAVVLLTCTGQTDLGLNWTVLFVDASINSPTITPGVGCAAGLQTLISAGFRVGKVANTQPSFLVYTMVAPTGTSY